VEKQVFATTRTEKTQYVRRLSDGSTSYAELKDTFDQHEVKIDVVTGSKNATFTQRNEPQ
jgi:hypothetical protein